VSARRPTRFIRDALSSGKVALRCGESSDLIPRLSRTSAVLGTSAIASPATRRRACAASAGKSVDDARVSTDIAGANGFDA
jgi:hypothetical protein